MHTLLKTQAEETSKDPSFFTADCGKDHISPNLRRKLLFRHYSNFDWHEGGSPGPIKFLDRDNIEFALCQAAQHDRNEERMARLCLNKGMSLVDEDGGIHQFASGSNWQRCRYSKSIAAQAGSLRLYSLAYALLGEHDYLMTARKIFSYIRRELLTAENFFRPVSIPTVFHRVGAGNTQASFPFRVRDNGWLIEALSSYYEFCGDQAALDTASQVMDVLLSPGHAVMDFLMVSDDYPDSLVDKLAMARACLQLYRTTSQAGLLEKCMLLADEIGDKHSHPSGGFCTTINGTTGRKTKRQIDENICLGRFFNLLYHNVEEQCYLDLARHGLRHLARPEVALARPEESGILLLEEELTSTPVKITILGSETDIKARDLFRQALRTFGWYKVVHRQ